MLENCFMFKLNLQPDILNDYEDNLDFLLNELIPNVLDLSVGIEPNTNFKNGLLELSSLDKGKDLATIFDTKFSTLSKDTYKLHSMYNDILNAFHENNAINYSKEFLDLNNTCKKNRGILEKEYPILQNAYKRISNKQIEIEATLSFDRSVGTGIKHLQQFYKLNRYVTKNRDKVVNPSKIRGFYLPSNEHIYVSTTNESLAIEYIKSLEIKINSQKNHNSKIGNVNINPIYESITFAPNTEITEISFVIVYPNGRNLPQERDDLLRSSQGLIDKRTIVGSDNEPLNIPPISDELNRQAERGYLKDLWVKNKNGGKNIIRKFKKINVKKLL